MFGHTQNWNISAPYTDIRLDRYRSMHQTPWRQSSGRSINSMPRKEPKPSVNEQPNSPRPDALHAQEISLGLTVEVIMYISNCRSGHVRSHEHWPGMEIISGRPNYGGCRRGLNRPPVWPQPVSCIVFCRDSTSGRGMWISRMR